VPQVITHCQKVWEKTIHMGFKHQKDLQISQTLLSEHIREDINIVNMKLPAWFDVV